MKNVSKLFICLLAGWSAQAICMGSTQMKPVVIRHNNSFAVLDNKGFHKVHNYDVDPLLRKMTIEQAKKFSESGCKVRATRLDNGDYVLRRHVPGLGGGPISAAIAFSVTQGLCWSGLIGAGIGAVAVTGGAALGAAGVIGGGAAGGAAAVGTAIGSMSGATAGSTGVLAGGAATTAGATAAAAGGATVGAAAGVAAVGTAVAAAPAVAAEVAVAAGAEVVATVTTAGTVTAGITYISATVASLFMALPIP